MRWQKGGRSRNLEDRRGGGMGRAGGMGIGGVVVVLLIALFTKQNPLTLLGALDQGGVPADEFGPIVVPEGHVFVMGDNRDDSSDSRVPVEEGGVGLLPVDYLIGEALIAFWSTDCSAGWWPWTWVSAARWERIGRTY